MRRFPFFFQVVFAVALASSIEAEEFDRFGLKEIDGTPSTFFLEREHRAPKESRERRTAFIKLSPRPFLKGKEEEYFRRLVAEEKELEDVPDWDTILGCLAGNCLGKGYYSTFPKSITVIQEEGEKVANVTIECVCSGPNDDFDPPPKCVYYMIPRAALAEETETIKVTVELKVMPWGYGHTAIEMTAETFSRILEMAPLPVFPPFEIDIEARLSD